MGKHEKGKEKHVHHYVPIRQETKGPDKNGNMTTYTFLKCDEKVGHCDERNKMEITHWKGRRSTNRKNK